MKTFYVFFICFLCFISKEINAQDFRQGKNIQIVVDEFYMISGDSSYKGMGEKLPSLIQIALPPVTKYKLYTYQELLKEVALPYNYQARVIDTTLSDIKNILDKKDITYVISGYYIETEGQLNCNIVLTERTTGKSINVNTGFGNYDEFISNILYSVQTLILSELKLLEKNKRPEIKTTAIIFNPLDKEELETFYMREISYELHRKITKSEMIYLYPYDSIYIYNQEPSADLIQQRDLDFLIVLNYHIKGKKITFLPAFKFASLDKEMTGKKVETYSVGGYPTWISDYEKYIVNLIEACTDDRGKWNKEIIASEFMDFEICYEKANKYLHDKKLAEAYVFSSHAISLNQLSSKAYDLNGRIEEALGNLDLAINSFKTSLKLKSSGETHVRLGDVYLKVGMYMDALENFKKAEEMNYKKSAFKLGKAYYFNLNYQEAVDYLSKSLLQDSLEVDERAEANFIIGNIYHAYLSDDSKAISYMQAALVIDPASEKTVKSLQSIYNTKGLNFYSEEDYKNAEVYFKLANSTFEDYESLYYLCKVYNKQHLFYKSDSLINYGIKNGHFNKNSIYADQANDLFNAKVSSPDTVLALRKQALYYLKQVEDSQAAIDKAESTRLIGLIYFDLKDYTNAEIYYKKVLKFEPANLVNYFNLIELDIILKKTDEALQLLASVEKQLLSSDMSESYVNLYLYLKCCALKMAGSDPSIEEGKLNAALKEKFFLNWSFDTFVHWLEQEKLNKEVKQYFTKLTNLMQSQALNY